MQQVIVDFGQFNVFGHPIGLRIYGYGLMLVLGFLAAVGLARWRARRFGENPEAVTSLGLLALAGGVVGARLAFVIERWDSEFSHLPNPLAGLSFLLAGRRCPLVVTYHADIVRQRYLLKPYLALLHRVLRRADRIVVATPNHIKYSRILPRYAGKCTVIPFGIDLSRFRLTAEIARAVDAIRRAHPGPRVLFIGRLVYYKGVEYLIRAMGRVGARLFVIGSGPLEGKLKALAGSGNLEGKIAFLGWVPEREKLAHLHACDLLVLPSVEPAEAFGMTQIEAMACSKPVVSTDLPSGVACVNRHGVTGLVVPPRDPAALAGAINRLLGDAVLRRRLGAAGRRLAESEYAEQRMGQRYRRVYLDIVGPAPGREAESRPLAYRAALRALEHHDQPPEMLPAQRDTVITHLLVGVLLMVGVLI